MKLAIRPFEYIFAVISLILFSQGFYTVIIGAESFQSGEDIDSIILRVAFLLIYFLTFCLIILRWQRTLAFLGTNVWLLFLVGLAIASITWSSIPDVTLRKVIALIGTTLFGLYLASGFNFEQQLKIYGWTFGISIFFSFVFAIALPEYGIMNTEAIVGAWRGIYPHKNGLGESMFASFLSFYLLSISTSNKKHQLLFQICSLLSVILIFFGESATALISAVFIFLTAQGLKPLSLRSKKNVLFILLFLILTALLIFLIMINFNAFLIANDKDTTLSGRTILWDSLWHFIQQKPWLGYGYGTFFSGLSREANLLWQEHDWSPVHAHNGYIQLWLQFGIVGLSAFTIGYMGCLFNSLFQYLVFKEPKMLWGFLFLLYTVFLNLTEVSFFGSNSIIWILSLVSIYSMKIKTRKIKTQVVKSTS
ncbi:O-antigen ligase [Pleurocapsa sp. PCC 7319]|uniref:O-antigen ligase family protein n=1 Tax=Pleurocapsa sp. PCC 7319 TaxID=118161 RepID=UPI0003492139|nr:O-antigen ligase family protein [Pleurocapsa sp. PCC 7319]